jgi:hypothetical protein
MDNADYEMRLSCTSGSEKRSGIIKLDTHTADSSELSRTGSLD